MTGPGRNEDIFNKWIYTKLQKGPPKMRTYKLLQKTEVSMICLQSYSLTI